MNKNDLMPNISFNPLKILRALCLVFAFIAVITPGQFAVAQGNPDASGLFCSSAKMFPEPRRGMKRH